MSFALHGVKVPHRKRTQGKPASRMNAPQKVTIPMSMHIGAPAKPVVAVGDTVKIGTKIAECKTSLCSPIYSSISGKVLKIADFMLSNGTKAPAIIIESDTEMLSDDSLSAPTVDSKESLIAAIKESGVVGLGGAGFPTYAKLDVEADRIQELIINGAECEPYITSDTLTMIERADDMAYAISIIKKYLGIKKVIIGVESNKKNAIASMRAMSAADSDIEVKVLPSIYPQGGEKVLIYHTTGKVVPVGKLPIDVGCVVINCTTLAVIGEYLKTGKPLVEKCITVDGGAVNNPQNVIVPIGTSISDVIDFCGGLKKEPAKVIYGGPMMGITVPDLSAPVLKNTNAVLALTQKEAKLPKTTACIRCGSCINVCPFGLAPAAIAAAYKNKNTERLNELTVNACMECGCCSFVCPANRPLVQTNKLSKAFLREEKAKGGDKA